MGKIRVKSFSKSKSGLKKPTSIPMEINKPETPSPIKSSVSSGRISKSPKKSVSFRSNLTDVVSAESLQDTTLSKGKTFSPGNKQNQSTKSIESRRSGKVLKKDIRDKRSRMRLKKKEFLKKIELLKLKNNEEKEAAKRKVIPIVGDTKALLDALMDVTTAPKEKPKKLRPLPKKRFSSKRRQEEIAEGLEYFAAALQHK